MKMKLPSEKSPNLSGGYHPINDQKNKLINPEIKSMLRKLLLNLLELNKLTINIKIIEIMRYKHTLYKS